MNRSISTNLILLSLMLPGTGIASTGDTIEEVAVFGYYRAESNTPITFQNISRTEIQNENYGQEPSLILNKTPSITVYSDSGGYSGYSYFRLRGMDQTRVNMTLDGAPLNEPEDQGVYFSNYPDFFSSLEGLQIQRGVGTTQNGTASYAGSIQFYSPDLQKSRKSAIETGYGSFHSWRIMGEHFSTLWNGQPVYLRGSKIESDGYTRRSENGSDSIFLSTETNGGASLWKLTSFVGQQKNQLAWLGVPEEELEQDPRKNGNSREDDKFKQALIILNNEWEINEHTNLQSGVYYNYLKGDYDFDLNNFLGLPSANELFNYALQSDFYGVFGNYKYQMDNLTLTTGLHINTYSRRHTGTEKTVGKLYENDGYKDEVSVSFKATYEASVFNLFLDIQYRETDFDYKGSVDFDKIDWSFVNPKAGVSVQLNQQTTGYYSIGKTSKEPTRTDIFGGNDNLELDEKGNPLVFITNDETVVNQELGIRYRKNNSLLDLNLYYMDFEDEIVLNGQFGPNGLALNQDVDKSTRSGIELIAEYQLVRNLRSKTSASWSDTKIKESGQSFEPVLTPDWTVNQDFIYRFSELTATLSWYYQGDSYLDLANAERLDSFYLINASILYSHKDFQARLHINNLSDKSYYTNGLVDFDGVSKYFIGAPRNAYLTLRYSF